MNLLNAVESEQKERKKKENNVVIFGVPTSTITTWGTWERRRKYYLPNFGGDWDKQSGARSSKKI